MLDVIKSYLVSLGFQVENSTFNQTQQSIKNMDKVVEGFAGNSVKNFAKAGTAVTSFFVTANIGIAKYLEGLAKADLQNEMFARRMWMSKENATAYKNSLAALGSDIQDLYLSPELLQKYMALRKQVEQIKPPQEYSEQMKKIRDITFEFQRLKLEATYAMQWVGYYLGKYLAKPIGDIKQKMKELNDNLSITMPHWTKQIAQVLSWIVRLGEAGAWGIKNLVQALDSLSPKTKIAGSAFLGFFALLKMGPIGWLIAGITALLLLMDDFKTYQDGGDSLFGGMWEEVNKLKQTLEDDGTFTDFKTSLDDISGSLGNILKDMGNVADKVATSLGFDDFADMLNSSVLSSLHILDDVLKSITGALETIDGILSGDADKIRSGLNKLFINDQIDVSKATKLGKSGDISGEIKEILKPAASEYAITTLFPWASSFFDLKNFVSTIKGLLSFEKHADGGIQTTPHFGLVAEDGPEAIIPLSANRRQNALKLLAQTSGLMGIPMTSTSSNIVNNITVKNSPSYKIYGSEPMATAKAVDRTVDYGILTRNFKGVY